MFSAGDSLWYPPQRRPVSSPALPRCCQNQLLNRPSDVAAQAMREQMKVYREGSFTDLKQGVKETIGKEVERRMRLKF